MPLLTVAEYLNKGGEVCPRCGSHDITSKGIDPHQTTASDEITCGECGLKWFDIWTLTGYQVKED